MKSILLTITAAIGFSGAMTAQEDIKSLPIGSKLEVGDVVMENANGEATSINNVKGENGVVLIFSCNTCPFVVGSESFGGWEKTYNDVVEKAKELGFGVIVINSNEAKRDSDDSMEKMKERVKQQGYSMPYVVDADSKVANALGAKTTPHIFVFDASDVLVYSGMIDNSVDSKRKEDIPYLVNALTELKSGKKVSTETTPPRGCSIKRKK